MTAFDIALLPYPERLHWQSRKDWPKGRVDHSSAMVVLALWGFGLAWSAITGTIAYVNHAKIAAAVARSWTQAIVPGLVFGLGPIVILCAIAATVSWRRNGVSTLVMETVPAYVGDVFRGTVEAGDILRGHNAFAVTLTCERVRAHLRTVPGSRGRRKKHAHFHREKLGSVSRTINQAATIGRDGKLVVAVAIEIPSGMPGSFHEINGTGIQWTLNIQSGDGRSPVFGAAFEIPVYRREDLDTRG